MKAEKIPDPNTEPLLELQEVRSRNPSSKEGMKLPGRNFEESGYTIKEIFAELAAGGKEVPDENHGVMMIYDRGGDVMAHIPFQQFDRMKDAVEKMALAKRDLDFFEGNELDKALAEWDAENQGKNQSGESREH